MEVVENLAGVDIKTDDFTSLSFDSVCRFPPDIARAVSSGHSSTSRVELGL